MVFSASTSCNETDLILSNRFTVETLSFLILLKEKLLEIRVLSLCPITLDKTTLLMLYQDKLQDQMLPRLRVLSSSTGEIYSRQHQAY
jgi:hypothetical protein